MSNTADHLTSRVFNYIYNKIKKYRSQANRFENEHIGLLCPETQHIQHTNQQEQQTLNFHIL